MSLKNRITDDMKNAMRAKDSARLSAIRLITAAIKQKEVDERIELDDAMVLAILEKMVKQRRDSIQQFEAAGRQELADQEKFELTVLQAYQPAQLDEDEVMAIIRAAVAEVGATGPQDMGKLMTVLKPRLAGRADMARVSQWVKTCF